MGLKGGMRKRVKLKRGGLRKRVGLRGGLRKRWRQKEEDEEEGSLKGRAGKRECLKGRILKGRVDWKGEELDNVNRRALKRRAEAEDIEKEGRFEGKWRS